MVDINDSSIIQQDRIGYIPENVNLYPYLTGVENLDYFSKLAGLKFTLEELARFLLECGLEEEAFNKSISEYSKGMRQKVGIAIAYAKNAKIYLLDEPASGLDPLSSNELSILLKKMSERGATILMASHDIFRVRETCHKIGILKNVPINQFFSFKVNNFRCWRQIYFVNHGAPPRPNRLNNHFRNILWLYSIFWRVTRLKI